MLLSDLTKRVVVALGLTVIADVLLFDHPLGVGLTIFALLVAIVLVLHYGRSLRRAGPWPFLWLTLALLASVEPSVTGLLLLVALTWAVLALVHMDGPRSLFRGVVRGTTGGFRSYTAAPSDARRVALIRAARLRIPVSPAWVYAVPAGLTLLFAILIVPANLVLSRWVDRAGEYAWDVFADVDLTRVCFWSLIFGGVYGLLRFKLGTRHPHPAARPAEVDDVRRTQELTACLLAFACLNVLFLAANAADLVYLWVRSELPEGLTYSRYAHRGAYRLIAAVVLAAATVVLFFRRGTRQVDDRRARWLAYAFIVQNVLVLFGAARRLALYAEAYGLTRLRVAVIFWLVLVAIGFLFLAIRIRKRRSLLFLLEANTASTFLVLICWAGLNIDGFVARWNVDRYLERGEAEVQMDVHYLSQLGPGALPALARLARDGEPKARVRAAAAVERMLADAKARHAAWAAWTWRRHAAIAEAEKFLGR